MLVRGNDRLARGTARWVALWTTLVTFAISLVMVGRFDPTSPEFQFVEKHPWLGVANYHMGVDGISLPFVILTTGLLDRHPEAREGIHDRVPDSGNVDGRHLLGA
jgi:NADH-quinone oxidoreductase subunit M